MYHDMVPLTVVIEVELVEWFQLGGRVEGGKPSSIRRRKHQPTNKKVRFACRSIVEGLSTSRVYDVTTVKKRRYLFT